MVEPEPVLPERQMKLEDIDAVNDALKELDEDAGEVTINSTITLSGESEKDKSFISKVKDHEFRSFKKLEVFRMDKFIPDERRQLNEFFEYATPIEPNFLYYIMLEGNNELLMLYIDKLRYTLHTVKNEAYFLTFIIDESTLAKLFECSNSVKRLALIDCRISIHGDFEIDDQEEYQIEEIDLYESCRTGEFKNKHYIDEEALISLAKGIFVTSIHFCLIFFYCRPI